MPFRSYKLFIVVNNLYNNISNYILCDAVNTLHQGILYFQNVIRFSHTCVYVISLTPIMKERPYPRQGSRNSKMLNGIICTTLTPNFTQIWWLREVWKYIISRPSAKYGFHYTNFHENHRCSTVLYAQLLHRISPRSDNDCGKYGNI